MKSSLKVVLLLGYSGSGKTYAISCFARALKRQGKVVGVLKRIHARNFSIDPRGKDTRTFAKSGATTIVAASPVQIVTIEKIHSDQINIKRILDTFRSKGTDYLFVEGWHSKFEGLHGIKRVLCVSHVRELRNLMKQHPRTLFIIARFASLKNRKVSQSYQVPVLLLPKDLKRALSLIS